MLPAVLLQGREVHLPLASAYSPARSVCRPNATAGYHGDAGECYVEGLGQWSPRSATAFVDAGVQAGHARNLDFNGASLEGVGAPVEERSLIR